MAHVIGMIERFIGWLKDKNVEFLTYEQIAESWVSGKQGAV